MGSTEFSEDVAVHIRDSGRTEGNHCKQNTRGGDMEKKEVYLGVGRKINKRATWGKLRGGGRNMTSSPRKRRVRGSGSKGQPPP